MKESILIKMRRDLTLAMNGVALALKKIENLEQQLKPKEDATTETKEVRNQ